MVGSIAVAHSERNVQALGNRALALALVDQALLGRERFRLFHKRIVSRNIDALTTLDFLLLTTAFNKHPFVIRYPWR